MPAIPGRGAGKDAGDPRAGSRQGCRRSQGGEPARMPAIPGRGAGYFLQKNAPAAYGRRGNGLTHLNDDTMT
ncbi:MAG: hypothetical protein RBT25_01665 [Lentisphaeria bacterium]|nr:hypothetical protein [Lentisphaeria bacterium]